MERLGKGKRMKVLAISPYAGMQEIVKQVAAKRKDIELTACVANIMELESVLKMIASGNYDIILSRGGTAKAIAGRTLVPVVEVAISVYDVLRVIKTAETFQGRFAIVGAANITQTARLLCDLLRYQIKIVEATGEAEVSEAIGRLKGEGYELIIGDNLSNRTARMQGLNSLLITSGQESIEQAFSEAAAIYKNYSDIKEENQRWRQGIEYAPCAVVILNERNEVFCNTLEDKPIYKKIWKLIMKSVDSFWERQASSLEQIIDNRLCRLDARMLHTSREKLLYIYVTMTYVPTILNNPAIRLVDVFRQDGNLDGIFPSVSGSLGGLRKKAAEYANTLQSVLILGEEGTGKTKTAYTLYSQSSYALNPFYEINCRLMTQKNWDQLMTSTNSILLGKKCTLFFRNMECLSGEQARMLLDYLHFSKADVRNRLLFSLKIPEKGEFSVKNEILQSLSCLVFQIPALRDRKEELPSMAALYINQMNQEFGKSVLNFEMDALEFLTAYSWPGNLTQFKRIIKELVISSETSYISLGALQKALWSEEDSDLSGYRLELTKTLDQITRDIALTVLKEEGGNKTKAAKRLGIARNTLWRILKE